MEYKTRDEIVNEIRFKMEREMMKNIYDSHCALIKSRPQSQMYISSRENYFNKDSIKDVIFNAPATIVLWGDGTKTVVKCQDRDTYSEELGFAMCIVKKCCQNKGNYNDVFNKWLPKDAE